MNSYCVAERTRPLHLLIGSVKIGVYITLFLRFRAYFGAKILRIIYRDSQIKLNLVKLPLGHRTLLALYGERPTPDEPAFRHVMMFAQGVLQYEIPKGLHGIFVTEGVGEADLDVLRAQTFYQADSHERMAGT